jgi:hypothetical protein
MIIFTALEYIILAATVVLFRFTDVPQWAVIIGMVAVLVLSFCKYAKNEKVSSNFLIAEGLIVTLPVLLFPSLKIRVIYALFCILLFVVGGHPLENGSEDDNDHSFTAMAIYPLVFHTLANIVFCIWPMEESRVFNIVFEVVLVLLVGYLAESVSGVKNYDSQMKEYQAREQERRQELERRELERQRQEQRQREERQRQRLEAQKKEKEREANYYRSEFYKAMQIPFETVDNDKGLYGEYCTSTWLSDNTYPYKALFSVSIPENTEIGSTELDCIVITMCGIIVIEVKNRSMKWLIDGNDPNAYCYDSHGNQRVINNPIRQNQNHIESLRRFIHENGDAKVQEAYKALGNCLIGYLVFGPDTIGWEITNTKQGYCAYNGIGKMFNTIISENPEKYQTEERKRAITTMYNFLLKYQNNEELKSKHDTLLKIKDFKKSLT